MNALNVICSFQFSQIPILLSYITSPIFLNPPVFPGGNSLYCSCLEKYFTSSDPHRDIIYCVIVSDISFGSMYISDILFWHSIWHSILTFYSIQAFYLASILTSYLASFLASILTFIWQSGILSDIFWYILSGIDSGILSDILFWHSTLRLFWLSILPFYLAFILIHSFILAFFLASILAFIHSGILSGILSEILFWHLFWHSFWHGHWDLAGARGWGPAVLTEICRTRRRNRRRRRIILLKSKNPHLAGGELTMCHCVMVRSPFLPAKSTHGKAIPWTWFLPSPWHRGPRADTRHRGHRGAPMCGRGEARASPLWLRRMNPWSQWRNTRMA